MKESVLWPILQRARNHATSQSDMLGTNFDVDKFERKFAELIVQECIDKIETHQIPVGNSAAGEMACEWTYDALKEIRNEIKQHFGVEE
jgi:predicted TIM-barrel fold metal-dependent hydrolase